MNIGRLFASRGHCKNQPVQRRVTLKVEALEDRAMPSVSPVFFPAPPTTSVTSTAVVSGTTINSEYNYAYDIMGRVISMT